MSDTLKALDDLGELLDQLASNAREFDYNTANRMERDAAKALLAIEAAVNALPELVAKVERLEEALEELANEDFSSRMVQEIARAALKETGQ